MTRKRILKHYKNNIKRPINALCLLMTTVFLGSFFIILFYDEFLGLSLFFSSLIGIWLTIQLSIYFKNKYKSILKK